MPKIDTAIHHATTLDLAAARLAADNRPALGKGCTDAAAFIRRECLPPEGVELPRMLVLSTGHITQATAGLFEMKTDDIPIHHDKGEYGWIIPLETGVPLPHTIPAELKGILDYAESLGATWVMLDRDADVIDALPSWSW